MLHIFILLAFAVAPLTQPGLTVVSGEYSSNPLRVEQTGSQYRQPRRSRRSASDASHYLGHGRPPKFSVHFDQEELISDGFAKRRLEALKDLVSLQFRSQIIEDNKPRAVVRKKAPLFHRNKHSELKDFHNYEQDFDLSYTTDYKDLTAEGPEDASDGGVAQGENSQNNIPEKLAIILQTAANTRWRPRIFHSIRTASSTSKPETLVSTRGSKNELKQTPTTEVESLILGSSSEHFGDKSSNLSILLKQLSSGANSPLTTWSKKGRLRSNDSQDTNHSRPQFVLYAPTTNGSAKTQDEPQTPNDNVFPILGAILKIGALPSGTQQAIGWYLIHASYIDIVALKNDRGKVVWMDLQVSYEDPERPKNQASRPLKIAFDKRVLLPITLAMLPIGLIWIGRYIELMGWWNAP